MISIAGPKRLLRVEALECALQLEKSVNQSLLDLHKVSTEHNDPHVSIILT